MISRSFIKSYKSFANLNLWVKEIDNYINDNTIKYLLANKCDLIDKREIPLELVNNAIVNFGYNYEEVSIFDSNIFKIIDKIISEAQIIKQKIEDKKLSKLEQIKKYWETEPYTYCTG